MTNSGDNEDEEKRTNLGFESFKKPNSNVREIKAEAPKILFEERTDQFNKYHDSIIDKIGAINEMNNENLNRITQIRDITEITRIILEQIELGLSWLLNLVNVFNESSWELLEKMSDLPPEDKSKYQKRLILKTNIIIFYNLLKIFTKSIRNLPPLQVTLLV